MARPIEDIFFTSFAVSCLNLLLLFSCLNLLLLLRSKSIWLSMFSDEFGMLMHEIFCF